MATKKQLLNSVWVEKFRPSTIKETVLPKSMKAFFTKLIKKEELPNLLLYSAKPGSGKTSIAKAICNELNVDYLYINASNAGIDVLRTDIQKYAQVKSLTGAQKVVILDEFDGATPQLQGALRADIERYTACRFIFTSNYVTKIIDPLRSRCQEVNFNMTDKQTAIEVKPKIVKRLESILKFENVDFKTETVSKIVDSYFPDIRKMTQLLQQYSNTTGIIDENIFNFQQIDDEFYQFILNRQLTKARTYLIEKNVNYDEMFRGLYDNFVPMLPKEQQGQVIILISTYMHSNAFVIDKEINFVALLLEIISEL